ncbi:MAG: hypothetical protein NW237_13205 [Cyanobacteriota bacterium]|nr:hypothetical protein [Cyanobacteriota bacterium]
MNLTTLRKISFGLCLTLLLFLASCSAKAPSRFEQAQQDSTQNKVSAVAPKAEQGGQFNPFFPPSQFGYERVFVQEKQGFAEAKLKRDGKDVAMLSISDTISLPSAAQKYQGSATFIAGYPTLEIGSTQTGILVAERYQIKAISRDPSFGQAERQAWIQRFDLEGLAQLK